MVQGQRKKETLVKGINVLIDVSLVEICMLINLRAER